MALEASKGQPLCWPPAYSGRKTGLGDSKKQACNRDNNKDKDDSMQDNNMENRRAGNKDDKIQSDIWDSNNHLYAKLGLPGGRKHWQ